MLPNLAAGFVKSWILKSEYSNHVLHFQLRENRDLYPRVRFNFS